MMDTIWLLLAVLAVALLAFAVVSRGAKTTKKAKAKSNSVSIDRDFVSRKWSNIQTMSQGNGSNLKDAVNEADKLLDYAMKGSGFKGSTMGERLKNHRGRFSDINSVWSAHKLRNALAHESDFDLVPSQAREAVANFEKALKDLRVL